MREIVLDTETTGLDPDRGDRIVEIGALELRNHVPTGQTYHQYINPERAMPGDAFAIHGIGPDLLDPPEEPKPGAMTLSDKPVFADIAPALRDFLGDARLVIHNAAFDMKFLNAELRWAKLPSIPPARAIDTLALAREKFPGSPASLDALCRRFDIDNSARILHGALLDAEILAEVYLELIGGRQPDFGLSQAARSARAGQDTTGPGDRPARRPRALPPRISDAEAAAHRAFIEKLGAGALWRKFSQDTG